MDIALDKNIDYGELNSFLQEHFSALNVFLIYEGINSWDDLKDAEIIIDYSINHEIESGYKYCLSIMYKCDLMTELLEHLSSTLSARFGCASSCDASRIILSSSPYYSLIFDDGKVYLADDCWYEESGIISKVIELSYSPPEVI